MADSPTQTRFRNVRVHAAFAAVVICGLTVLAICLAGIVVGMAVLVGSKAEYLSAYMEY